jgi:hypothetical protein
MTPLLDEVPAATVTSVKFRCDPVELKADVALSVDVFFNTFPRFTVVAVMVRLATTSTVAVAVVPDVIAPPRVALVAETVGVIVCTPVVPPVKVRLAVPLADRANVVPLPVDPVIEPLVPVAPKPL